VVKGLLYIGLSAVSLLLLLAAGVFVWLRWEQHLPSDQAARRQFDSHRREYIRFASLLRQDPRVGIIGSDGVVSGDAKHAGPVAQYRDMMRSLGAKQIIVGEDGSIEFVLWGTGCTICSASYKGLRYVPDDLSIVSKFTSEPKPDIVSGFACRCWPRLRQRRLRRHVAAELRVLMAPQGGGVWWSEALQGGGVAPGAATCLAAAVGNCSSQCFKGTLSDQAVLESRSRSKRRTWM
jgi:hypothetical protein